MGIVNTVSAVILFALALFGPLLRKAPGPVLAKSTTKKSLGLDAGVALYRKSVYVPLTALLMLLALAVRVWQFTGVPAGVNQDEAMAAVDAYALAFHGTDRFGTWLPAHFTAWGYGQMSVLMSYLAVPFMWVFGLNTLSIRLPVLIVSMAGVWVLHRFAGSAFGREVGLAALALAAVNPWHIMQSRWALDCNLMAHFMLFGVYGLYLGAISKKRFAYIGIVMMALGMYTYGIAVYTLPVLLLVLAWYFLAKHLYSVKHILLCAGLFLVISFPILMTMAINAFGWDTISLPFVTMPYFPDSVRSNDLLPFAEDITAQFVKNAGSLGKILLQYPDLPWNAIDGFGTMYTFSIVPMVMGLLTPVAVFATNRRKKQQKKKPVVSAAASNSLGGAVLAIWLAVSVFSGLMVNGANVNRVNHIFYPLILLAALGLCAITRRAPRWVSGVPAVLYATALCLFCISYFGTHAKTLARYNFQGFGESIKAAEEQESSRVVISTYTQFENARQTTEILTLFYTQADALYFQGKAAVKGERLPYAERYQYADLRNNPPDAAPDTSYVFNARQRDLFPDEQYAVEMYDGYGVARTRQPN